MEPENPIDNSEFNRLFARARNLSPDEQMAFLSRECPDERQRRELVKLLESFRKAPKDSFVNPMLPGDAVVRAFADAAAGFDDTTNYASRDFFIGPGTQVGPYKILELIGEGGMGSVYVAEQKEPMHRRVALKIIKPGIDSKDTLARFEAERQALSMMDHPHIARILDAGSTDAGRPYFVMELVKGVAITEYCDRHRYSANQRLALFAAVCQALAHAHQKGIIHRDIKPSNVLIANYDDEPVVKVIDFGVAKATSHKLSNNTVYTRFGQLVGTFEYMSPEQAKLNQLDIDTRSDIYSLGVLLYELITGTTPFDRQRLRSAALNEMVRIICEEDPPTPSTRLIGSATTRKVAEDRHANAEHLVKTVRGELDWIIMRSLEKERKRRYQTAIDLARDVQRFLAGDVVEACPPTFFYRTKKFVLRNRVQTIAGIATLALLLVSSVSGWLLYKLLYDETAEAAARIQNALESVNRSEVNFGTHPGASLRAAIDAVEATYRYDGTALHIARATLQKSIGRLGGELVVADQGKLSKVSLSNDGKWLVIGTDEGPLLCDLSKLNAAPVRLPHKKGQNVKFSPDMKWIMSAGSNGVMLWNFAGANTANAGSRLLAASDKDRGAMGLEISGNSRHAVVGYYGGSIHVWDLKSNDPAHSDRVISLDATGKKMLGDCVALDADGTKLVTASEDGRVCLWDLTGKEITKLRNYSHQGVRSIALSPDGRWLASSGAGSSRLWDLSKPDAVSLVLNGVECDGVTFSEDNRFLAVGGTPCFLYDLTRENVLESCLALNVDGRIPEFSRDNDWLLTRGVNRAIQIWNLSWLNDQDLPSWTEVDGTTYHVWSPTSSAENAMSVYGHDDLITSMEFSTTGEFFVSASWDGSARLWKLHQTNPAGTLVFESYGNVQCSAVSPDGKWLAVGRKGRDSKLWKLADNEGLCRSLPLENTADGIGKVVFSPNCRWLVGTSAVSNFQDEFGFTRNESVAHIWDLSSADPGQQVLELQHGGAVTSIAFNKSSDRLVTGCTDGIVRVWSMSEPINQQPIWQGYHPVQTTDGEETELALEGDASKQMIVAITDDGSTVVSASGKGDVLIWELDQSPVRPKRLNGLEYCPLDAAISGDGRWVAAGGGYDRYSYVWDLHSTTSENGIRIPGHIWPNGSFVTNVEFSPDGRWLATASWDKRTNLFDLQRRHPLAEPVETIETAGSIQSLTFSLDGRRLIAGSMAMPIVIDLERYPDEIGTYALPVESVSTVALTPDGKRAITGARNEVQIWDLDIETLLSNAKARVGTGR